MNWRVKLVLMNLAVAAALYFSAGLLV